MDTAFWIKCGVGLFCGTVGRLMQKIGESKGWRHPLLIAWGLTAVSIAIAFVAILVTESQLNMILAQVISQLFFLSIVWGIPNGYKKQIYNEAGMEGGLKKCNFCAETIKAEAIKCRYCGSLTNQATPNTKTISHEPSTVFIADKIFKCNCKFCGNGFRFFAGDEGKEVRCSRCGNLSYLPEVAKPAPPFLASDGSICFSCHECDQPLAVDENGAGQFIDCPSCKKEIQIPKDWESLKIRA